MYLYLYNIKLASILWLFLLILFFLLLLYIRIDIVHMKARIDIRLLLYCSLFGPIWIFDRFCSATTSLQAM